MTPLTTRVQNGHQELMHVKTVLESCTTDDKTSRHYLDLNPYDVFITSSKSSSGYEVHHRAVPVFGDTLTKNRSLHTIGQHLESGALQQITASIHANTSMDQNCPPLNSLKGRDLKTRLALCGEITELLSKLAFIQVQESKELAKNSIFVRCLNTTSKIVLDLLSQITYAFFQVFFNSRGANFAKRRASAIRSFHTEAASSFVPEIRYEQNVRVIFRIYLFRS